MPADPRRVKELFAAALALPDEPAPQHTQPFLKQVEHPLPFSKHPVRLRQNAWLAASAGVGAMIE